MEIFRDFALAATYLPPPTFDWDDLGFPLTVHLFLGLVPRTQGKRFRILPPRNMQEIMNNMANRIHRRITRVDVELI